MTQKKFLTIIPAVLLAIAFGITLAQVWGSALNDISVGIVVYALYGFLILSYFLRFALIFLGIFAIYRIFREKYREQMIV